MKFVLRFCAPTFAFGHWRCRAYVVALATCLVFSFVANPTAAPPRSVDSLVSSEAANRLGLSNDDLNLPQTAADQLVNYPSPQIAFICGPQLKSGSRLNPAPWFDQTAREQGISHGENTPRIAPIGPMTLSKDKNEWINVIAGQVSVSQGSAIVTGKGTRFTLDIDPVGPAPRFDGHLRIRDATGVERSFKVRSVESDTRLTLAAPWSFPSVSGAIADTFQDDHRTGANVDHYYLSNYYDTALVQYINHYRSGDPKFLGYARKSADAFWHSMWIGDGTTTGGINHLPPRSQAFAGLMVRALDGRPEFWDYLYGEIRATFDNWLKRRRNDSSLYYDIREDGYAQLYAVILARVLPDRYPLYANGTLMPPTGVANDGAQKRAALVADAEDIALNFFGRLQKPDGSWRWSVDAGSNLEQPFMVGLYLESAILLHQLTRSPTVKANLADQIVRSCRHLYRDAYRGAEVVRDLPQYHWRGMWYFWGEQRISNPDYKLVEVDRLTHGDPGMIRYVRHLNSTIHHAFGYAFVMTGDQEFLRMG